MAAVRASERLRTRRRGMNLVPVIKRVDSKRHSPPVLRSKTIKQPKTEPLNHNSTQDGLYSVTKSSLKSADTNVITSTVDKNVSKVNKSMHTVKMCVELHPRGTRPTNVSPNSRSRQSKVSVVAGIKRKRSYSPVLEKSKLLSSKETNKRVKIERHWETETLISDKPPPKPSTSNKQDPQMIDPSDNCSVEKTQVEEVDAPISLDPMKDFILTFTSSQTIQSQWTEKRVNVMDDPTDNTHSISSTQHSTCIHQHCLSTDPLTTKSNSQQLLSTGELPLDQNAQSTVCELSTLTCEEDTLQYSNADVEYPQPSTPKQKMARQLARQRQLKEMKAREAAYERQQRLLLRRGLLIRSNAEKDDVRRKRISWKEECDLVQVFVYSPPHEMVGDISADIIPQ